MSNISYIQDGFLIILPVMKKFVKTKLRATYGENWLNILSQRGIEIHREGNYQINANNPEEVFDSADLNSTVFMLTSGSMWNTDFRKCGISKAYIQELRDVRNKVSHTDGEDLSDDDTFLLSYFVPSASLGVYSQGQQLSTQPVEVLACTTRRVFFASFSKVQKDERQLHDLFVRLFRLVLGGSAALAGVMFPLMGLIPIIYNDAWQPTVGIARVLCLSIPCYALMAFEGVLITIGGERRRLISTIIRASIMSVGIIILFTALPDADMRHVAALVLLSSAIGVVCNIQYIIQALHVTRHDLKRCIMPVAAGLFIMAAGIIITMLFL